MVNHYDVYIVDEDFGPLCVKFCSYFPYNAKLCINGHEHLKRYDLRRLRLRGLIERIPHTRRYRVTEDGLRTALCYHRTHARVMRPATAVGFDAARAPPASAVCSTPSITRSTGSGRVVHSPPDSQPDCKLQLCSRNLGTHAR